MIHWQENETRCCVECGGIQSEFNLAHPYDRERVLLLVVQVLLDVEERVKEDMSHLAPLKIPQSDLTWTTKISYFKWNIYVVDIRQLVSVYMRFSLGSSTGNPATTSTKSFYGLPHLGAEGGMGVVFCPQIKTEYGFGDNISNSGCK